MGLSRPVEPLRLAASLRVEDHAAKALWETTSQSRFPGALLPIREGSNLVVYAVSETAIEWRKLQPLLLAFAGPTLTNFDGTPHRLDSSRPFEAKLLDAPLHAMARLQLGRYPHAETWVMASLRRLQSLLETAPDLGTARPEPTSRLLARLQDALNVADIEDAWRIHGLLGHELRLDALNLTQLEMQILAASGRWSDIRWHDRFEILCNSGPTHFCSRLYFMHNSRMSQNRNPLPTKKYGAISFRRSVGHCSGLSTLTQAQKLHAYPSCRNWMHFLLH